MWNFAVALIWTIRLKWAYSILIGNFLWLPVCAVLRPPPEKVSLEEMNATKTLMFEAAAAIKAQPAELQEKLQQMMGELRDLRHAVEKYKAKSGW